MLETEQITQIMTTGILVTCWQNGPITGIYEFGGKLYSINCTADEEFRNFVVIDGKELEISSILN